MELSNKIAIGALVISILGMPVSAFFSYKYAEMSYSNQLINKEVNDIARYKEKLESRVTLFGRIMKTVAEKNGVDFDSALALETINKNKAIISKEVFQYGIIQEIKGSLDKLDETVFFKYLEQKHSIKFENLILLKLNLETSIDTPEEQVFLTYKMLIENGVISLLKDINEDDIRTFIESNGT